MRRVDAEGDSRGVRGQQESGSRSRSRLRRAAIEWLERRELLSTSTSTLPSPTVLSVPNLTPNQQFQDASLASAPQALTAGPQASSPSVSVDPLNPLKIVATWVNQDSVGYNDGGNITPAITKYIDGAFSTDGGRTWNPLPAATFGGANDYGVTVNLQQDFTVVPAPGPLHVFSETTDVSVAFDRNENFYILSSTHNTPAPVTGATPAGVLDLQRWSFVGANTPSFKGTNQIYSWDSVDGGTADAAVNPTLAVDTNLPTFTDPTTNKTITDRFSGNIYAAWAGFDSNTFFGIPNFNPDTIKLSVSSDQGLLFTHAAYVDNSSNANGHNVSVITNPPPPPNILHDSAARYAAPQIAISQGNASGTVPAGQVTLVYDDYGTVAPLDQILTQTDLNGGTSAQFNYLNTTGQPNIGSLIPITVNISDSKFITLQDLEVTTSIAWPNISEIGAILVPPAPILTYLRKALNNPNYQGITLFQGDVGINNSSGTPSSAANLGASSGTGVGFGTGSGTVFDPEALRSIEDGSASKTATGHYMPDDEAAFLLLKGLAANPVGALPGLNGVWNFAALDFVVDSNTTAPKYVNGVTLSFTSGDNPGAAAGNAGAESLVAGKNTLFASLIPNINSTNPTTANAYGVAVNTNNPASPFYDATAGTNVSGSGNTIAAVQPGVAILPAPVITSDNTLGSFSQHSGRIYVAFTGEFTGAQAGNTDIFLAFSDDGGKTWQSSLGGVGSVQQVNDDNGATDGISGSVAGNLPGRTQFQPQVAVDSSSGDLVLSFYDARNDPSDARVATYIAASQDGGSTFASEVYANPSSFATDAVTGNTVNLGPIPDNESAAGGIASPLAYGVHQALIVTNGRIVPFWTSNQNMGVKTAIVDSILSLAAGPRIIASTQGPVGANGDLTNTTRAADGTTLANTITVTFDQAVDPASFTTANVAVFFKSPTGGTSISLPIVSVIPVAGTPVADTKWTIVFNPASLVSKVGTYSYVIIPTTATSTIRSLVRTANAPAVTAGVFGFAAPAGSAVAATQSYASTSVTVAGHPNQFLVGDPSGARANNAAFPNGNVAGTITATITAGQIAGSLAVPSAFDFIVNLVTPDGQRVALNGVFSKDGLTETFNATPFTLPWVKTVALDGNYTLEVIDDVNNETIAISNWQLTVNGVLVTPSSNTGQVADQNADGTSGQLTGDNISNTAFNAQAGDNYVAGQPPIFSDFAPGTLPLIVSGPHILATAAIGSTGVVIGTGSNDLVVNNVVSGVQVAFDRNIQVSSFNAAQILRIFGPAGAVSLAGITITPISVFTTTGQAVYAGGATANLFKITFATQQLSGTYSITIGTGILAADGSGVDANLNAGLDVLRGTATNGVTTPVSYAAVSPAVPVTIAPATVNSDGSTSPSLLMSPIAVPVDFPIQGDNTATGVSGLTLSLNITYPTDPDLVAYLLSPTGVKINLFTKVGGGTNTANFSSTTFSDTATTSIDKAGAPFFGTFLPESPFANLATAGLDSLGTWNLVIVNNGNNTGMLTSWSLTFQKPVSATGLAEFPDDQTTVGFQIFNLAASNALANSTWTAVGPAGITPSRNGLGTFAGAISTTAVDPSDKTGNTVYVGSASGGIWKTTNFLTTNPSGPTYQPLTDFGPDFSLNVGSIAIFGRNNDPAQSVLFAGTGFGQEATNSTAGTPNVDLNSGRGVGILRSMDGGLTWTLLDSTVNIAADGSILSESLRDHQFLGDTTYKIIVDPTPTLSGGIIVYAALGGPTGGLYQSLDSGNTWKLLSAGISGGSQVYVNATDILLDPNSKSPTTGNLDTLYAAFGTYGVYVSTNQGQVLQQVTGQLGKDPLIVTPGFPATPIPVQNSQGVTPNNILGSYVVLGKPALTTSISENLDYQGWLFAAVENGDGSFNGLYVTKDAGENWTKVQLPNIPGNGSVKLAIPTNDTSGANSYDPTSSKFAKQGQYNLTLTVDPTNPNIVYLGGSQNFQQSGLIRVDLTTLQDAHNFTSFSNKRSDGGTLTANSQGGVDVATAGMAALYQPIGAPSESQILNLRYAPNNGTPGTSPFNINATLVAARVGAGFVNDGTGVTWTPFDEPLKANAGDLTGSTNLHDVIDYVDPITGNVRLLFADDQGIFTALVNPDGTLNNGIGTDVARQYSRNGNIQNEQFFDSAAQPSFVASQAAGALFYASGQNTLAAQSDPNVLLNGNLTWDNSAVTSPSPTSPRSTTANGSISTSDRSGVGIATDQTGGVSAASPSGTPSVYEYDVPILGGNLTDFFRVNQFGQTTGLAGNINADFPANNFRGIVVKGGSNTQLVNAANNGQLPLGNFAVNPLNGQQILIGSATGNLYESVNQGISFTRIGVPGNYQIAEGGLAANIQLSAIVYGAPDPNVSGGVGNLNNFIYVGTTGGVNPFPGFPEKDGLLQNDARIFLTQAGGQGWTDASEGLDGSSIVGIYPSPDRGSHAAYAVTLTGVFYSPDTVKLALAGQTVWTNITSNLAGIQRNPFGNPTYQESVLAGFVGSNIAGAVGSNPTDTNVYTAQYGGFTGVVADYRYEIPAATNATQGTNIFYPVLYVSGYGGVFRSIDNGTTWTVFPNTAFDAAPVDGGYLPSVDVTNLQLVLGNINPDTGHATQNSNSTIIGGQPDPEILLATTFGRGDFAIRLAPDVIPDSVAFDQSLPIPNGSDSGISSTDLITNVLQPYIDGISEVSNFGNVVTINLIDQSLNPDGTPTAGFGTVLGTGLTNQLGQFVHLDTATNTFVAGIQIVNNGTDPTFFTSSTAANDKIVGIRATDSSGASGNLTLFRYTLDLITPVTPDQPVLEAIYDTGRSNSDDLTNLSVPPQTGPGAPLTIITPTFDVTTSLPQANPLTPNPISLTVELLRATSPTGPFFEINSTQTGFINATGTAETYMLTDADAAAQALAGIDITFYYEALQVDAAGNVSATASPILPVTINTIAPVSPTGLTLDPTTNSGGSTSSPYQTDFIHPLFDVTGVLPNDQVLIYRSVNGGAPTLVSDPANPVINTTNATATLKIADFLGATSDGIYTYYAAQLDIFGNFSPLSPMITVTINTEQPPAVPILEAGFDTGRSNKDDVTNIAVPAPTPGVVPNFVVPVFDVNTVAPATGQPPIATVQLFRATSPTGPYTMVGTAAFNGNPAMVTDSDLQAMVAAAFASGKPINQKYYYEADDINAANIESAKSAPLTVLVDTVTPPTLAAPTLDPSSNTGLNKSQLITNQVRPIFDYTNLLPGNQVFLYRSTGGKAQVLVGASPVINTTNGPISGTVKDTSGAIPDGVFQYFVVQQDLAGNISAFSPAVPVTVNTGIPVVPTIALLASDDSGLPSHPNVTNVNTPHFVGTAPFNPNTPLPLDLINVATGAVIGSGVVAANGTYLAQVVSPLADGVYQIEARTTNVAGTASFSSPLMITIKHTGPQIVPSLVLLPADDTGIKGDGVTSNHQPRFIGTTDRGDTVSLFALVNGVLLGPEAITTASTINGSFTFTLPFNLTDGFTQLVAQTSDIANNKGVLSPPYAVRIASTQGDYLGFGKAQFSVFDPYNETYFIRNIGAFTVDATPGRDLPVQYDYNGDGATDVAAYRYNTAEYFGFVSNGTTIDMPFGAGGSSLPVSGYYGYGGTYVYGSYQPATATWAIALPTPGGLVINFGVPRVDIPTPAAFNGNGSTELAVFRPSTFFGGDADSFTVFGPTGPYMVSFTSPAVAKLGFVYQAGDIADPGDYDGVGRDEFAVYRPSTGQFFILNTPNVGNSATWTLRTVGLNLPGGPKLGDQPVSEDYSGTGKFDPTVYRPSNSTFYSISTLSGLQSNIPFGPANQSVAAAGPLLYRLTALFGVYSTTGGYLGTSGGGTGGGGLSGSSYPVGGVHAESVTPPSGITAPAKALAPSQAGSPLATMIAVAAPLPVISAPPSPLVPPTSSVASGLAVTVGASTPRAFVPTVLVNTTGFTNQGKARKLAKPVVVESKSHAAPVKAKAAEVKAHEAASNASHAAQIHATASAAKARTSHAKAAAMAATSLQHLVMAAKGRKKS